MDNQRYSVSEERLSKKSNQTLMQIKRATEQDLDALVGFMQKVWRAHYRYYYR